MNLFQLPFDICCYILTFLDTNSVLYNRQICKLWIKATSSNIAWSNSQLNLYTTFNSYILTRLLISIPFLKSIYCNFNKYTDYASASMLHTVLILNRFLCCPLTKITTLHFDKLILDEITLSKIKDIISSKQSSLKNVYFSRLQHSTSSMLIFPEFLLYLLQVPLAELKYNCSANGAHRRMSILVLPHHVFSTTHCTSFKKLILSTVTLYDDNVNLLCEFINLECLIVFEIIEVSMDTLIKLSKNLNNLHTLNVRLFEPHSFDFLFNFKNLTHIAISSCRNYGREDQFANHLICAANAQEIALSNRLESLLLFTSFSLGTLYSLLKLPQLTCLSFPIGNFNNQKNKFNNFIQQLCKHQIPKSAHNQHNLFHFSKMYSDCVVLTRNTKIELIDFLKTISIPGQQF